MLLSQAKKEQKERKRERERERRKEGKKERKERDLALKDFERWMRSETGFGNFKENLAHGRPAHKNLQTVSCLLDERYPLVNIF